MNNFPEKCVVDTNVPKTANLAIDPQNIPNELVSCVRACIEAIEHVSQNGGLVLDAGDEIFDEYRKKLSMKGQPGVGDKFMKWVHDNRWKFPDSDRVIITKRGTSYNEFPNHPDLKQVDTSDHKFIATANVHLEKPPILEATDSKWWGWEKALDSVGIKVIFLCSGYIKDKYLKKMS